MKPEPEGFLNFWREWAPFQRASDGRAKARPAYQQMIEAGADPEDIIAGARWYLRNLPTRDREYIPLAASWLRSERWADDAPKEMAFQSRAQNIVPMRREA